MDHSLNRCNDKRIKSYKRCVNSSILGDNLHRIGYQLIRL